MHRGGLSTPIVNLIFVDFDGPAPNASVEVLSLLVDTDHRDLGAMVRYDRRMGTHEFVCLINDSGATSITELLVDRASTATCRVDESQIPLGAS